MALFEGEPIVEISFNGQTVKVPASVAAQMAIPRQQQEPSPLQVAVPEHTLLGSTAPNPLPPPPPPPPPPNQVRGGRYNDEEETARVPAMETPSAFPNGMPLPGQEQPAPAVDSSVRELPAVPQAQLTKEMKGRAADSAKPAPGKMIGPVRPGSPQDTVEGALSQTDLALKRQEEAGRKAAAAESIGQAVMAGAYEDQLKRTDELVAQRNKEAQDRLTAIQQKEAAASSAQEKYANAKIDRKADHPTLGLIGAILGGLGSALKGDGTKNTGLDALMVSLDRKVAGQMQDIERQGKVVGMMREGIEGMRKVAGDQLALRNLMIAGEAERTAIMIKKIASQSNSEVLKTRGDELAGQLMERSASARMQAVNKQIEVDTHNKDRAQRDMENKRQVGLGYANLGENKRQFNLTLTDKKEQRDADMAKAIMEADKAGNTARSKLLADAAKENSQRGVGNVITGDYMLQPGGKKAFAEATKLEQRATELDKTNKPAADAMRTKAAQIRTDVLADEANGVWRVGSPDAKAKIADGYAAAQQVAGIAQEIKDLARGHEKNWATTDVGRAQIQAKVTTLTMHLKNAWGLGVLSKQDIALVNEATGGDPTQMTADQLAYAVTNGLVGKDASAFEGRLDALGADVKKGFLHTARGHGYRGDANGLFGEETTPKNGPAAESYKQLYSEESIDKQNEKGLSSNKGKYSVGGVDVDVGAGVRGVQKGIFGHDEQDTINSRGEFPGSLLTKGQAAAADDLIARAKKGEPEAQKFLMDAATQKDSDIAPAIVTRMKQAGLNDMANAAITAGGGKPVNDASISIVPPHELGARASIGDREAMKELGRLSAAGNDTARRYLKAAIDYRAQNGYQPVQVQDDPTEGVDSSGNRVNMVKK